MRNLKIDKETLPVVKAGLTMKRNALKFNLKRYQERLSAFEKKYNMDSQTFLKKFNQGELGDDADWFEWQYLLEAYQETIAQMGKLAKVRL